MDDAHLALGQRKLQNRWGGYLNGFVKPVKRVGTKRRASKRVRTEDDDIPNGAFYKRLWGYWEWV